MLQNALYDESDVIEDALVEGREEGHGQIGNLERLPTKQP